MQQFFHFLWRQEIPEINLTFQRPRTVKHCLCFRIKTPIHTADALHEPDRIPMEIIIDNQTRILQVQTFGQDIGGYENINGFFKTDGQLGRISAIIIGRKPFDNDLPVLDISAAVNLFHIFETRFPKLIRQISGGISELAEYDDFPAFEQFIFSKMT